MPAEKIDTKQQHKQGQFAKKKSAKKRKPRLTAKQKRERQSFARVFMSSLIALLSILLLILIIQTSGQESEIPSAQGSRESNVHSEQSSKGQYGDLSNTAPDRSNAESDQAPIHTHEDSANFDNKAESTVQTSAPEPPTAIVPPSTSLPRLVVVIDDVGNNLDDLLPFLAIPVPISFAVLPQLPYSEQSARLVQQAGKELILHQPLESKGGQNPGPGVVTESMTAGEIRSVIERNIASVPGIVGMNNHMGSKGSENERIVAQILQKAEEKALFFLDSRTTAQTVIPRVVQDYNVPLAERDVFLDNEQSRDYIAQALERGKQIAQDQGFAVLIGHAGSSELASLLASEYESIEGEGFVFARLGDVAEVRLPQESQGAGQNQSAPLSQQAETSAQETPQ